jgi:hypothetical protein
MPPRRLTDGPQSWHPDRAGRVDGGDYRHHAGRQPGGELGNRKRPEKHQPPFLMIGRPVRPVVAIRAVMGQSI